jgi:hypothetical protein
VLGDWSGDGHEKTSTFVYDSNKPLDELEAAYHKASSILGFDLINDVARDYEDSRIKTLYLDRLINYSSRITEQNIHAVLDPHTHGDPYDPADAFYSITQEIYMNLFVEILMIGDPTIKLTPKKFDNSNIWNIGGYGLFY